MVRQLTPGGKCINPSSDTCKRRHTRCDEKKPICGNCARLDIPCDRNDDAWKVDCTGPARDPQPPQGRMLDFSAVPSSTIDVFRSHLDRLDQIDSPPQEAPASTTPPTTASSSATETNTISPEGAFLLQTYVKTVATWMDLFDHSRTYQLKVPPLALTSPLLYHCVCAFTANHLALSNASLNASWKLIAAQHYGQALRLLITALSTPGVETAILATTLLLSYELHGAMRSDDYRRHFLGMASLIRSRGITAQSPGTDGASFWIYCRHDIAVALARENPLVLDPARWGVAWAQDEQRADELGNQMMWMLARVINLVFGPRGRSAASRRAREALLSELEAWRAGLPACFVGVAYGGVDDDGFRSIYFSVTAAAAAAFWFHTAHVLLYAEPEVQDEACIALIQEQAVKVANIAMSEFPAALKVFSTHGLYYAAKHVKTVSQKARVWNVLKDVERETGYHTSSTVQKLQAEVDEHINRRRDCRRIEDDRHVNSGATR